ncbi:MAG TPA: hypothetical protein VF808_06175 [Ktedonobacterales bacterium]
MDHRAHMLMPIQRLVRALGALLTLSALLAGCALDGGSASQTQSQPTATATPVPLQLDLYTHLTSVAMRSPTEGWAVGYQFADAASHPLLLHYINGAWQAATPPTVNFYPKTIVMVSDTEGWIAGGVTDDYNVAGVMLHGVNGQWAAVTLPAGTGKITGMAMVSADEGWAVAASTSAGPSRILHYTQGAWNVQFTMPDASELLSVSMTSASDGWAAGIGMGHGALWHYSGGTWTRVLLNDPQGADLESVVMLSATEGWGAGLLPLPYKSDDQAQATGVAVWRYTNGQWQVVKRDTSARFIHLGGMQAEPTGGVWVSETSESGKGFLHFASGSWQTVAAPIRDGVTSLAFTGVNSGWAVGAAGQILRYANDSWTDYPTGAVAS